MTNIGHMPPAQHVALIILMEPCVSDSVIAAKDPGCNQAAAGVRAHVCGAGRIFYLRFFPLQGANARRQRSSRCAVQRARMKRSVNDSLSHCRVTNHRSYSPVSYLFQRFWPTQGSIDLSQVGNRRKLNGVELSRAEIPSVSAAVASAVEPTRMEDL
jgi:hypothetical protein